MEKNNQVRVPKIDATIVLRCSNESDLKGLSETVKISQISQETWKIQTKKWAWKYIAFYFSGKNYWKIGGKKSEVKDHAKIHWKSCVKPKSKKIKKKSGWNFGTKKSSVKPNLTQPNLTLVEKISSKKIGGNFVKTIKVEKILKGSLDSIPSPSRSVKIQISRRQKFEFSLKVRVMRLNPGCLLKSFLL